MQVQCCKFLSFHSQAYPVLAYQPGDSFDVFCPNRAADVDHMLHRLGLHSQRNHHVNISLQKDTKKKGNTTTGTFLKITHNMDPIKLILLIFLLPLLKVPRCHPTSHRMFLSCFCSPGVWRSEVFLRRYQFPYIALQLLAA